MSDFEIVARCIDCQRVTGQVATDLPEEMRQRMVAAMRRLERCADCAQLKGMNG